MTNILNRLERDAVPVENPSAILDADFAIPADQASVKIDSATEYAGRPNPNFGLPQERFLSLHQKFLTEKDTHADIVFLGDSITEGWLSDGLSAWNRLAAHHLIRNLGISGDRLQHLLWRIENGELDGVSPKLVVLLIGTNNIGVNTPEEITVGVAEIIRRIHSAVVGVQVLLVNILPRSYDSMVDGRKDSERLAVEQANDLIRRLENGRNIFFLEAWRSFLDDNENLRRDLMPDGLHLSQEGYAVFSKLLKQKIDVLLASPIRSKKTRYAIVGTGGRAVMFTDPIVGQFQKDSELVGLCDTSVTRGLYYQRRLVREFGAPRVPFYQSFDAMLDDQDPDVVIVCTPDYLHHEFIVKSLEFGADVISEKPLTISADGCRAIFDAVERTGRKVRTTFNLRWSAGAGKVREIIASGAIGEVKHVDFDYALNTSHGADYFRRWHSQKICSGGLLVHKSTHHFDLVNWWLDAIPQTVFAMGDLVFYGKKNAIKRGQSPLTMYERYTGEPAAQKDPFRLNLEAEETLAELYLNAEKETGYIRDKNVFRDDINIEDSMSVLVRYRTGAMLAYSLNAFSPVEGFRVVISGDGGRIEYQEHLDTHLISEGCDEPSIERSARLIVQKHFSRQYEIPLEKCEGGHGGADPLIQEQMFSACPDVDALGRNAGHEQGAASLMIGVAANQAIETGFPVELAELFPLSPLAKRLHQLV